MKLVSYHGRQGLSAGLVHDGRIADLASLVPSHAQAFTTVRAFLAAGEEAIGIAQAALAAAIARGEAGTWPSLDTVTLGPPIPDPGAFYALAANYRAHIEEGGGTVVPKEQLVPRVFIKPATCIIGPNEAIRLPGPICTEVDYEAELGVVIGQTCRAVPAAEALDYVAGYLNVNDISGRSLTIDVPRTTGADTDFFDWLIGKWFDTFAPMGPFLVLRDEIADPQGLAIDLSVNGQRRQAATTGDMIFTVAEAVAWLSRFVTLRPGDIIATGTPSGVGATSGTYLQAGDIIEMGVAGLGRLRNVVVPPAEPEA